ncbi:hypothetical protein [Nocardioides terrisoli]|uniref:hypothetical protein n=1 Tax=Nocardioides terrisoli TaxID=3388267 RepID=UPI00287B7F4A|nr:hypothetical protein [Nocardioides marmorisolisilvae]
MGTTTLIALVVAALALLAVAVLAVLLSTERRRTTRVLDASRMEQDELRSRVDQLARSVASPTTEFVITDAGPLGDAAVDRARGLVPGEPDPTVMNRVVLSATVGEPLVRAVAFSHGLRRALSPASRNRIRFEIRREVRRARKQRRQEMREAWRRMRAEESAA